MTRSRLPLLAAALVTAASLARPAGAQPTGAEALALVRAHADAMLHYGRDHYGPRQTAFFTQMVDLRTLAAPTQRTYRDWALEAKHWKEDQAYNAWGKFWNAKESPASGNLGRDAEFLNSLYLLSHLTGDRKYARAADAYLRDFLRLAISPTTGLWATGAHADYDLVDDRIDGTRHEMERQIVPYDRIWAMNPRAVTRYAQAVVEGHFQDLSRFGWNRHAYLDTPRVQSEFGNFVEYGSAFAYLWAFTGAKTGDPLYRDWIHRLMISYASHTDETTSRFAHAWYSDYRLQTPVQYRYGGGVCQLFFKAAQVMPDPWLLWPALANLDDAYRDDPHWEQAAWGAYWQGYPWGGTTVLEAYRLTGNPKYLQWARGFAARFDRVPVPRARMAMMVAGNMDFFTLLYQATGEKVWLDKARSFIPMAREFADRRSGMFAGAIGLDRPLYYDATQGPGYLCEALLRLYQACTHPARPQTFVKWRLAFPEINLQWVPPRWAGSQPLVVRAHIKAPQGVVNPRLLYTRDSVIDLKRFSLPGRRVAGDLYEFTLPAPGVAFDAPVALAVAAGNGRNPLNWATSTWRQVTIFPQETRQAQAGKPCTFACGVTAGIGAGGTLEVSRTRWNPAEVEPSDLGTPSGDYLQITGRAEVKTLALTFRLKSVEQMMADTITFATFRAGRWQKVPTRVDMARRLATTDQASAGLWTLVGDSRILWDAGDPCSYYSAVAADFYDDGRLEVMVPNNGLHGGGGMALLDAQGKFTFIPHDKQPSPGMRFAPPGLADGDGDGKPEIFMGNEDGTVWCVDRQARVRWQFTAGDGFWTPVAIGDITGDGRPEVAAGCVDHWLYVLDAATGTLLWKREFDGEVETSPVMVDLTGDGVCEVLAGSGESQVFAFRGDGTPLWEYRVESGANCVTGGDLREDGQVEVAISTGDSKLLLLDAAGKKLWEYQWEPSDPERSGLYQIVAGDINGDGKREIVVGSEDGWCLALSPEGRLLWKADMENRVFGCPSLLDLDADGRLEVVCASTEHVVKALRGTDGSTIWRCKAGSYHLVAADLNGDGLVELFQTTPGRNHCLRTEMKCKPYGVIWGMQRGDARRTGVR